MLRGRGTGMGTWPMPVKQCREGCVSNPSVWPRRWADLGCHPRARRPDKARNSCWRGLPLLSGQHGA